MLNPNKVCVLRVDWVYGIVYEMRLFIDILGQLEDSAMCIDTILTSAIVH